MKSSIKIHVLKCELIHLNNVIPLEIYACVPFIDNSKDG